MKKKNTLRKVLFALLLLATFAYFGQNYWIRWKVMSSLPEVAAKESFDIDYFNSPTQKTVTANNVEYSIVDPRTKWIPVIYTEKDFSSFEGHVHTLLEDVNDASSYSLSGIYTTLSTIRNDDDVEKMETLLSEWCTTRSESHIPWIVRGIFRKNLAWRIRGSGYADSVSQDSRRGFREYLELAAEDLEKSYAIFPGDPNSSSELVTVSRGLGIPEDRLEEHYQRALAAFPWHFYAASHKLEHLKPKWHGTIEKMDSFAEQMFSLREEHPHLGLIMLNVINERHFILNKGEKYLSQDVVWKKVQDVYERLFERYPEELRHRFYYAHTAYRAERFGEAVTQFGIIGDRWVSGTSFDSLDIYNATRAESHARLGHELLNQKRNEDAIGHLEIANKYDRTAYSSYPLGFAYQHSGYQKKSTLLIRKAQAEYRKALSIDPDYKAAKKELIKLVKMFN
jgi:tetratricopeptide (TPR) repeat protein